MNKISTLAVGVALGVTLLLSVVCARVFAIWSDRTLDFFGAHWLDLITVKSTALMSAGHVLYGVVGLGIVGVVYASIFNVVAPPGVGKYERSAARYAGALL
jgi:hypothetical protein